MLCMSHPAQLCCARSGQAAPRLGSDVFFPYYIREESCGAGEDVVQYGPIGQWLPKGYPFFFMEGQHMSRMTTPQTGQPTPQVKVPHDKIAMRAYEKWVKRGRPHGSSEQDWVDAENE